MIRVEHPAGYTAWYRIDRNAAHPHGFRVVAWNTQVPVEPDGWVWLDVEEALSDIEHLLEEGANVVFEPDGGPSIPSINELEDFFDTKLGAEATRAHLRAMTHEAEEHGLYDRAEVSAEDSPLSD